MKEILGAITVLLAVFSYGFYVRSILTDKIKPHMYSWLIWSILAGIGFAGQISDNAGPGAWNTGVTAIGCFIIFLFSIDKGEKSLIFIDKILLAVALVAVAIQLFANNHVLAVSMATLAALVGFSFTLKKAYKDPTKESSLTFFVNANRNFISLFALSKVSFLTFFYPLCMGIVGMSVVAVILLRRKTI